MYERARMPAVGSDRQLLNRPLTTDMYANISAAA